MALSKAQWDRVAELENRIREINILIQAFELEGDNQEADQWAAIRGKHQAELLDLALEHTRG